MGRKLLKIVQTITTFRNPLADPIGTRRGPPLVRGAQFENRCTRAFQFAIRSDSLCESIRFLKNRPFDSLVVMQFLH